MLEGATDRQMLLVYPASQQIPDVMDGIRSDVRRLGRAVGASVSGTAPVTLYVRMTLNDQSTGPQPPVLTPNIAKIVVGQGNRVEFLPPVVDENTKNILSHFCVIIQNQMDADDVSDVEQLRNGNIRNPLPTEFRDGDDGCILLNVQTDKAKRTGAKYGLFATLQKSNGVPGFRVYVVSATEDFRNTDLNYPWNSYYANIASSLVATVFAASRIGPQYTEQVIATRGMFCLREIHAFNRMFSKMYTEPARYWSRVIEEAIELKAHGQLHFGLHKPR